LKLIQVAPLPYQRDDFFIAIATGELYERDLQQRAIQRRGIRR
jgi:hypothetical protein